MTDVVDKAKRSQMMSGIRSKNTAPELIIRRELHRRGFRYRLHDKHLPGKPDIVMPKYKAIIQVNGCFWHGHDCHLMKWPSTRPEFWREKIQGNCVRDDMNNSACIDQGWRVLSIWECAIKGKRKKELSEVVLETVAWLVSDTLEKDIRGI